MGYYPKCVLTKGLGRRWAGRTDARSERRDACGMGAGRRAEQGVRGAGASGGRKRARKERHGHPGGRAAVGRRAAASRRASAAGGRWGVLGARPVRTGWARLVHCAPGSVLTRFLTQI